LKKQEKPNAEAQRLGDILSSLIKKKDISVAEAARRLGYTGNREQAFRFYVQGRNLPKGPQFFESWKKEFGEDIQQMLYNIPTNVSRGTSMVVEHQEVIKETFYKDLIENNDEYSILPKALLRDYKMVPEKILERINQNNDELKAALVEKYERYIAILEKENEALKAQLQKR
jgi:hypothetical protein